MIRTIAVDATGGDYGPFEAVKAAAEASLSGEVACHVIGDGGVIESLLARHDHNPRRLSLTDAGQFRAAARTRCTPGSWPALEVAADLVRRGEVDAAVSAGDTGACVSTWIREFSLLPGVSRPALASFFPRRPIAPSHPPVGLILDVGATLRCHPRDYLNLAMMGTAYYETLTGARPRVGLLNVGAESHKGGEMLARSAAMLGDLGSRIDFVGNVESSRLLDGEVDVVLCDGFTGNVLLKTLEGVAETAARLLHEALHKNLIWRVGIMMLSGGLRALREATDYAEYGGSPLLGSSAVFIKAHGRSKARALQNAIRTAARVTDAALPGRLAEALATLQELPQRSWLRLRPSSTPTT